MYYYDNFQHDLDRLHSNIRVLKNEKKYKEADLLKLKMLYTKIKYYTECTKYNPKDKQYQYNLTCALNEIGSFRDYLWETYQYEET